MKLQELLKTNKEISYFYNKFNVLDDVDVQQTHFATMRDIYAELNDSDKIIIAYHYNGDYVILKRHGSNFHTGSHLYDYCFRDKYNTEYHAGKFQHSLAEYTTLYVLTTKSRIDLRSSRELNKYDDGDAQFKITQRCLKKIEPRIKRKALRTFHVDMKKFIDSEQYAIVSKMIYFIEDKEFNGTTTSQTWNTDYTYRKIKQAINTQMPSKDVKEFRLSTFTDIKTYYDNIEELGLNFVMAALES